MSNIELATTIAMELLRRVSAAHGAMLPAAVLLLTLMTAVAVPMVATTGVLVCLHRVLNAAYRFKPRKVVTR